VTDMSGGVSVAAWTADGGWCLQYVVRYGPLQRQRGSIICMLAATVNIPKCVILFYSCGGDVILIM
jgi:hypothetical protein